MSAVAMLAMASVLGVTPALAAMTAKFEPITLPDLDPAKNHIRASQMVTLCSEDGACEQVPIAYHTIARSGMGIPSMNGEGEEVYGLIRDNDGQPLFMTNDTGMPDEAMTLDVSDNPDFSSLIQVGDEFYSIVQFEWPNPGVMYLVKLSQDDKGNLSPVSSTMIDWSHQGGLWIPCAGSLSPWNTHIGGEEYEPDAKYFSEELYPTDEDVCGASYSVCLSPEGCEDEEAEGPTAWNECKEVRSSYHFAKYLADGDQKYPANISGIADLRTILNPYDYGYVYEVAVKEGGDYNASKWYAVGRRSNELAYIMPDQKTLYASDDGTNVVFHKFVADEAGDFSSGTLYAAKLNQTTDGSKSGTFGVEWIDLGSATSEEIEKAAKTLKFHDMFEVAKPEVNFETEPYTAVCPEGFEAVNTGGTGLECLKVKDGMDTVASRLESRRYSAMKGATTELSKFEGVSFDPKRNKLYAAVSSLKNGMEDNQKGGEDDLSYDIGNGNDIKVAYNKCGCIYTMDLDESSSVTSMSPLVCGDPNGGDELNECNIDEIANPDNVAYLDGLDVLLIAEDTSKHENNVLWSYNIDEGTKDRIMMVPKGAEVTSPYLYKLGEYDYIMAVSQHPQEETTDASNSGRAGQIGYIGPLKLTST